MKRQVFSKVLSCLLVAIMLITAVPVGAVSVDENSTETYRYYFYRPDSWGASDDEVTIWWYENEYDYDSMISYVMNKTDIEDLFYYDVPVEVKDFTLYNCIDPEQEDYVYYASVECDGYQWYMASPLYPKGIDNFNNMVYVLDPDYIPFVYDDYTSMHGEWFYYYGNGEYGTAEEKTDTTVVYTSNTFEHTNIAPNGEKVPDNGALWGLEYVVENGEVTITGYNGVISYNVPLPSTIDECPVTKIADKAFENNIILASVILPASILEIGKRAFYGTDILDISVDADNPNYVSVDGVLFTKDMTTLVYYPLKSEHSYTVPDGVKRIEEFAFVCNYYLYYIELPESLEEIGEGAFQACDFSKVTIPKNVNYIGKNAFLYCDEMTRFIVDENNQHFSVYNRALYSKDYSVMYKYPNGCEDEYYEVHENTATIDEGAFAKNKYLENVKFFNVETIGDSAFYECNSLKEIDLGEKVVKIGSDAFYNCVNLAAVDLGEKVVEIGSNAFIYCEKLSDIELPETLTKIGEYAFYDCMNIKSVVIPDGVTEIPKNTFDNCKRLESVSLPETLTSIGYRAFDSCNTLKEINIPDSVKFIGSEAFARCYQLENVILPKNLKELGSGAFMYCSKLKNIAVPEGVKSIESYTFAYCTNLEYIILPESIELLDYASFKDDYKLKDVFYAGSKTQWKEIEVGYEYMLYYDNIHYKTTEPHYELDSVVSEPDCTKNGEYKYSCPCGYTKKVSIKKLAHDFVNGVCTKCQSMDLHESEHNYANDCDETWSIYRENAKTISVTFSNDTYTENGYDYIYIYDGSDNLIGKYSGSSLAGKTITVDSDTVKIRLVSNAYYAYYGFKITEITADYGLETSTTETTVATETAEGTTATAVVTDSTEETTTTSVVTETTEETTSTTVATDSTEGTTATTVVTDPTEEVTTEAVVTEPTEETTTTAVVTEPTEETTVTKPAETKPSETTSSVTEATDPAETTKPTDFAPSVTETTEPSKPANVIVDDKTQITVEIKKDAEVELKVVEIANEEKIEEIDLLLVGEKTVKVFDITLVNDGVEVQPDGKVTVRIPVGNVNAKIYRMEADGTLTDMNAVYKDGYLEFTTEHFSLYVVAEPESDNTKPSEPVVDKGILGDVNGDGKVNIKDATMIQKAAAKILSLTEDENIRANVNGDKKVNVKDATAIQKFVAKIETGFPIGEAIVS